MPGRRHAVGRCWWRGPPRTAVHSPCPTGANSPRSSSVVTRSVQGQSRGSGWRRPGGGCGRSGVGQADGAFGFVGFEVAEVERAAAGFVEGADVGGGKNLSGVVVVELDVAAVEAGQFAQRAPVRRARPRSCAGCAGRVGERRATRGVAAVSFSGTASESRSEKHLMMLSTVVLASPEARSFFSPVRMPRLVSSAKAVFPQGGGCGL